jgi:hypothetical protein
MPGVGRSRGPDGRPRKNDSRNSAMTLPQFGSARPRPCLCEARAPWRDVTSIAAGFLIDMSGEISDG